MTLIVRKDGRRSDELRPFQVTSDIQPRAYASLLMATGATEVVCAVSLEEKLPPFLENGRQGWITAEYGILPGATSTRYRRETDGRSGRSMEIQRLIGRSLRQSIDLRDLYPFTLRVDCDVLNADGGTRTAAITGAALAVNNALQRLYREERLARLPAVTPVTAVSAGVVDGVVLLDLNYEEDSRAEADGNFVMAGTAWVEIQATAENGPLHDRDFNAMKEVARAGGEMLQSLWR